jgi:hypothetical protein
MSTTVTRTPASLRDVILDALSDAFYSRRANVEECRDCTRNPGGVCPAHEKDSGLARAYEEAQRAIRNTGGDGGVLRLLGIGGAGS